MRFHELQTALRVLGLGERATMTEIKARYRQLVRQRHPDAAGGDSEDIRRINAANRLILGYLRDYRFSFSEDEFYEQNPEERMAMQFMETPQWGAQ